MKKLILLLSFIPVFSFSQSINEIDAAGNEDIISSSVMEASYSERELIAFVLFFLQIMAELFAYH